MNVIQPTQWGHRFVVGLALPILVTLAAPVRVSAHGGDNGPLATNYRSEITDPGADGLTWGVRGGDGLVALNNDTGQEGAVFAYQAEPYLWFVPAHGVYRNTSSATTYLDGAWWPPVAALSVVASVLVAVVALTTHARTLRDVTPAERPVPAPTT